MPNLYQYNGKEWIEIAKNGLDGKDATEIDPKAIVDLLKKLPEKEKLDISHLRNSTQLTAALGKMENYDKDGFKFNGKKIKFEELLHGGGSGGSGTVGPGTANQIAYFDTTTTVNSLTTATYPSLTELSYVKGVTSALQTQISAKMTNPMTTGGDIIYGGALGAPARLVNGTSGQVLTSQGTTVAPIWSTVASGGGITIGTTTITNGTSARILYDSAGIVQEPSYITVRPTGLAIGAATTADALADSLFATSATTQKGLVIQGKASQTANLQEWQSSTGAVIANMRVDGLTIAAGFSNALNVSNNTLVVDGNNGYVGVGVVPTNKFHVLGATSVFLTMDTLNAQSFMNILANNVSKGYFGYTNSGSGGLSFLDSTGGTINFLITDAGKLGLGNTSPGNKFSLYAPTTADSLADALIATSATTQKGLVIQGKAGQSANLQEWQKSDGTIYSQVTAVGIHTFPVGNALTAAGTTRTDALQLVAQINNITTAAAGTGVILPVGVIGMRITIFNAGANLIQVYASASETIDTVAGSTGVPLTNAKRCDYFFVAANTWVSAQLGAVSA